MNFSTLKLIIGREYMSIVGRKSFLVMTLLIPLLILLCSCLPMLFMYINDISSGGMETVAIIDETGNYAQAIKPLEGYRFVPLAGQKGSDARGFYNAAKESISAVVVIPADVLEHPAVNVYSENLVNLPLKEHLAQCLSDTLTAVKVASFGVADLQRMIDESQVNVDVSGIKWDKNGEESETSSEFASILGMLLSMFIYMFVIMYGAMIMNSVIEEKTNRIVEVMVSSCKPFELMMGKIIGVGLVGLTQFAVWVGILMAVGGIFNMTMAVDAVSQAEGLDHDAITEVITALRSVNFVSLAVFFFFYFIGGYLLYASMFAGFGSAVDQANDASQFQVPIIIVMMIALYAGIASATNPNGQMAVWCSIIPFTSPVVMMVRLPYDVPLWQIALSLVLLYGTAALFVWLSAKIYRTGILLYGKKHSWSEVLKWLKVGSIN